MTFCSVSRYFLLYEMSFKDGFFFKKTCRYLKNFILQICIGWLSFEYIKQKSILNSIHLFHIKDNDLNATLKGANGNFHTCHCFT